MNDVIDSFYSHWEDKLSNQELSLPELEGQPVVVLFLSIGNPDIRARVEHVMADTFQKAMSHLKDKAKQLVRKNFINPAWVKIDFVTAIQKIDFPTLEKEIAQTRKNYFRSGIAFDKDFRLAFLEQEINGNAMIRSVQKSPLQLNETNISRYLTSHSNQTLPFMKNRYINKSVYTFQTEAAFIDRANEKGVLELYNGELTNGIRKTDNTEEEIHSLIQDTTYFLQNQLKEDGQFEYGYFSAFAKRIPTYNILRHSSTLYAMGEGYEQIRDESLLTSIAQGIDYAIREAIQYFDEEETIAYMVDYANHNEIKLGANATAILAMAKYMEITNLINILRKHRHLQEGFWK